MNLILKALISLLVGAVVAFVVGRVLAHFGYDLFWAWLVGVIAGLSYFFYGTGPVLPPATRP